MSRGRRRLSPMRHKMEIKPRLAVWTINRNRFAGQRCQQQQPQATTTNSSDNEHAVLESWIHCKTDEASTKANPGTLSFLLFI